MRPLILLMLPGLPAVHFLAGHRLNVSIAP